MALPEFNAAGDLSEGVYRAALEDLLARFGGGTTERRKATATLLKIYRMARATEKLDRLIVFGSYVTSKKAPRDVDIILVMRDNFDMQASDEPTRLLFDHRLAEERLGASVFWIRPAMLVNESLESFIEHWQLRRDGGRRGIVEIAP